VEDNIFTFLDFKTMETIIIIYTIGVIVSYFILRYIRIQSSAHRWKDIIQSFIFSLVSWLTVLILIVILITENWEGDGPEWL